MNEYETDTTFRLSKHPPKLMDSKEVAGWVDSIERWRETKNITLPRLLLAGLLRRALATIQEYENQEEEL